MMYVELMKKIFLADPRELMGVRPWNEYNWNATFIVVDGKIMKPNFAW